MPIPVLIFKKPINSKTKQLIINHLKEDISMNRIHFPKMIDDKSYSTREIELFEFKNKNNVTKGYREK